MRAVAIDPTHPRCGRGWLQLWAGLHVCIETLLVGRSVLGFLMLMTMKCIDQCFNIQRFNR